MIRDRLLRFLDHLLRFLLTPTGLLACLGLAMGIHNLGLRGMILVVTFCAVAGASASLGWHGVAFFFARREERQQARRRHRVPRQDRDQRRAAPAADQLAGEDHADRSVADGLAPAEAHAPSVERRPDTPAADGSSGLFTGRPGMTWFESVAEDQREDLYAHRLAGPA